MQRGGYNMVVIENDWDELLKDEFKKPYYIQLRNFLSIEYATKEVYPNMYDIFNALKYTAYKDVKVVILGQDPYHGRNQAHGLCFSVQRGVNPPPSLQNIFIELQHDVGCQIPDHGDLSAWTKQGVLMLNTVLTVQKGLANSHANHGWEQLTDYIIQLLNKREDPIVFIFWGKHAQSKKIFINKPHHLILMSAHPSPFSANYGFFGSRHFSKTNAFLRNLGKEEIQWQL